MPEIWIPYGGVETLVTLQAENLGVVAAPPAEDVNSEAERISELLKTTTQLLICDSSPPTMELLKGGLGAISEAQNIKIFSPAPKRIETSVPELKGRIVTLAPPLPADDGSDVVYAPQLLEGGAKLFVGSARPDPMFGVMDAKVEACLAWVTHSKAASIGSPSGMEPQPLRKTPAYDTIEGLANRIPESKFLTVVSRGGKLRAVMEDAPFDAVKNAFPRFEVQQSKGMVLGAGGRGYDDTFSSALRGDGSARDGVRKTGSVLVVAECSVGVGSTALEMLISGRMAEGERRNRKYVDGLEEIFYLNKLKDEYDVLLLSGLPETYARTKLGLATAKGSGEAVGRILNRVGRSGKVNVVPRAPECLVQSA